MSAYSLRLRPWLHQPGCRGAILHSMGVPAQETLPAQDCPSLEKLISSMKRRNCHFWQISDCYRIHGRVRALPIRIRIVGIARDGRLPRVCAPRKYSDYRIHKQATRKRDRDLKIYARGQPLSGARAGDGEAALDSYKEAK